MSNSQQHQTSKNNHYYSTYSSDVYDQDEHNQTEKEEHEYIAKKANLATRNWLFRIILNPNILIVICSTVAFAFILAPNQNENIPDPVYKIGRVLAPPEVNDITALQIADVLYTVNKRTIFDEFLANLDSSKSALEFGDINEYHTQLRISGDSKKYKTVDSVLVSLDEVNDPEIANRWLGSYLTFASEATIDYFIKQAQRKIDDRKDELSIEINNITKKVESANQELVDQINRYKNAIATAKNRGIVESISASNLPTAERFGDLLYLQGTWKLEQQLVRFENQLKTQVINASQEQEELKKLLSIEIDESQIRTFSIELIPDIENLTPEAFAPKSWSPTGAFAGFFVGYILSLFLRRKTRK